MTYKELFLTIQNTTQYREDFDHVGINWYYLNADNKLFMLFQETKTFKDWLFNFLIIPFPVRINKKWYWFPLGAFIQAKTALKYILYDVANNNLNVKDIKVIGSGWSAGGISVAIVMLYLKTCLGIDFELITYGTPAFCLTKKTLANLQSECLKWNNYLYHKDWIRFLIPGYKRPESLTVIPEKEPHTLDEKHRIYGKAQYSPQEIE